MDSELYIYHLLVLLNFNLSNDTQGITFPILSQNNLHLLFNCLYYHLTSG